MPSLRGKHCLFLVLAAVLWGGIACGGGGGGTGGRTRDTALRIVHGSLDGSPLAVHIGEELLQQAHYAQVTDYVRVPKGEVLVRIERANSPGTVIRELATTFEDNTEYSLFVFGEARDGSWTPVFLAEPVEQPGRGFARVQLLNALEGSSRLTLKGSDFSAGPVSFGSTSGFVQTASGPQVLTVTNSSGRQVATFDLEIVDQGELTLLVTGSEDLGVRFSRIYPDLD